MNSNYITTIIILLLLLVLCNTFIHIDQKIIEGQDSGNTFSCTNLSENPSIDFTTLPENILQPYNTYENSSNLF